LELIATLPGLVLAFFETVVLSAISVAISTRLPMLANLIVCATVYVLGHLVPMLVNSSVGKFEIVRFVGQFIATVLPVLDHFNIQAAVAAGAIVPTSYLWMALLYCIVYSSIAMLLGLAMFEDRDLA
jgi:Na+/glutamate symporter